MLTDTAKEKLVDLLTRKYRSYIGGKFFTVNAEPHMGGVAVSVILRNQSRSYFYPVEARIRHGEANLTETEAALFLVDYIDVYFDEFFRAGGEVYLPIDWADFTYGGKTFQLRGQILNLELEQMADDWIKKADSAYH
jgi:hypothetical protein